jgi:hypothetical protein
MPTAPQFPQSLQRKRSEAFSRMTPAARQLAIEFKKILDQPDGSTIQNLHKLGTMLFVALNPATSEGVYGCHVIRELARFLEIGRLVTKSVTDHVIHKRGERLLLSLRQLAQRFPESTVSRLASMTMSNGEHPTLQHWLLLEHSKSTPMAVELLENAIQNNWTPRDLEKAVFSSGVLRNMPWKKRKSNVPENPIIAIDKTIKLCERVVRWQDTAHESIVEPMMRATVEKGATEGLVRLARDTIEALDKIEKVATTLRDGITAGITHVQEILKLKKEMKCSTDSNPSPPTRKPKDASLHLKPHS